ncbi:MAG TPA: CpsB/CapC family capsule biosynthesis tyrosine phosphatase [Solirubrobacteraceae bacterium]|nr:CpsB/CapC family capsule biosynthesis tyrosine phosphatase [Solirubrobacteraceae bacterium]
MIDLHFHALPGIDDGPPSADSSVELLRAAWQAGTRVVVATPHIDFRHGVTLAQSARATVALRDELREAQVDVRLLAGGEIATSRVSQLSEAELRGLRLGGGSHLLVECPHRGDFPGLPLELVVRGLQRRGHGVLLAHPERCHLFLTDPERLRGLVDAGALCALTAGAFTGAYGRGPRDLALWSLEQGLGHVLVSDAHDVSHRPPGLGDALAEIAAELPGAESLAPWLTHDVPAALLAATDVPPPPASG